MLAYEKRCQTYIFIIDLSIIMINSCEYNMHPSILFFISRINHVENLIDEIFNYIIFVEHLVLFTVLIPFHLDAVLIYA